MLRLVLAGLVAIAHAQAIGWGDQPALGHALVGDLAVDGFFVISGFLVTRSVARLPSIRRFVWHRVLRIMPGFWVCLLVTAFGVAPLIAWLQGHPPTVVFTGPQSAFGYVTRNAALLIRQWGIAGLLDSGHETAIDGSLWTLFYEAACYAVVGLLAAVGVISRRRSSPAGGPHPRAAGTPVAALIRFRHHLLLIITVLVWLACSLRAAGILQAGPQLLPRFLLVFLLGALGHVYAHRIRFTPALITTAALTLAFALVMLPDYLPLGAAPFTYLFLWAMVALPLRWDPATDLSYGTYVYHWPVVLVLTQVGWTAAGRAAFTLTALAVTTLAALASWHFVEAPALRHKHARWIDTWPHLIKFR